MVFGDSRNQHGPSTRRIICYGDSNTVGQHSSGSGRGFQPYGESLAAELALRGVPCEVVVCGLCGHTTEDMLDDKDSGYVQPTLHGRPLGPSGRGLKRMLEEVGPVDLVVIMTGTNDIGLACTTGVGGLGSIVQSIKQLHAMCHDMGVPTVALAPTTGTSPQPRTLRQALCDFLVGFAASSPNVLDCLDVEDLVPGKGGKSNYPGATGNWEQDDVHMTRVGSCFLGRRLAPYVAQCLEGGCSRSRTPSPLRFNTVETDSARDERSSTPIEARTLGYFGNGSEQAALTIRSIDHDMQGQLHNLTTVEAAPVRVLASRPFAGCALAVGGASHARLTSPRFHGRVGIRA